MSFNQRQTVSLGPGRSHSGLVPSGLDDRGPAFSLPLDHSSCRFDFEEVEALVGRKPGLLMDVKYNAAAEIGLDRRLLCAMRSASNLKETIAEVLNSCATPVPRYASV